MESRLDRRGSSVNPRVRLAFPASNIITAAAAATFQVHPAEQGDRDEQVARGGHPRAESLLLPAENEDHRPS